MNNLTWMITFITMIMIATLLHELAHAYVAKENNIPVVCFQIGFGKKLFSVGKINVMSLPIGAGAGIDIEPNKEEICYQMNLIKVFFAGIVVNLVFYLITTISNLYFHNELLELFAEVNLILILQNIMPMKVLGATTDGMRIIKSLKIIKTKLNKKGGVVCH